MKLIISLLFFIAYTKIKAQPIKDTLLVNKSANQIIFIDPAYSKFHHLVFSILLPEIHQNDTIKLNFEKSKELNSGYIGEWITIKKFKGKYFAYFPSEPYYNIYFKLTDSIFLINEFNEGFISFKIEEKKSKGKKLRVELLGDNGVNHYISIKQKANTIFTVKSSLFTTKKMTFVKRQSYYSFPIIVNYCPTNRCQEFNFK